MLISLVSWRCRSGLGLTTAGREVRRGKSGGEPRRGSCEGGVSRLHKKRRGENRTGKLEESDKGTCASSSLVLSESSALSFPLCLCSALARLINAISCSVALSLVSLFPSRCVSLVKVREEGGKRETHSASSTSGIASIASIASSGFGRRRFGGGPVSAASCSCMLNLARGDG